MHINSSEGTRLQDPRTVLEQHRSVNRTLVASTESPGVKNVNSGKRQSEYHTIFVLGGGIFWNGDGYAPTTEEHGNEYGLLWGDIRNKAAVTLWFAGRSDRFGFVGGKVDPSGWYSEGEHIPLPYEGDVYESRFLNDITSMRSDPYIARFLTARGLVEDPETFPINRSRTIRENIVEIAGYIEDNGLENEQVGVIGNDYLADRLGLVLGAFPHKVTYIPAESTIADLSMGVGISLKNEVYNSPLGAIRLGYEREGARRILEGEYLPPSSRPMTASVLQQYSFSRTTELD